MYVLYVGICNVCGLVWKQIYTSIPSYIFRDIQATFRAYYTPHCIGRYILLWAGLRRERTCEKNICNIISIENRNTVGIFLFFRLRKFTRISFYQTEFRHGVLVQNKTMKSSITRAELMNSPLDKVNKNGWAKLYWEEHDVQTMWTFLDAMLAWI